MTVQRMDHVGVNVADLEAATRFFVALGLEVQNTGSVEGAEVDRIVGLDGVRSDLVMLQTPDGRRCLELVRFRSPAPVTGAPRAPANAPGLRHVTFAVDDLNATLARLAEHGAELVGDVVRYGDSFRLCYLRGPEGVIVELAEPVG